MVADRFHEIQRRVRAACERSGRDPKDVTLIAVSKTKPVSDVREAYEVGARDFGENKVQEILEKYPQLPEDIRWHMIGHLQTNKVRQVVEKVCLIHSVDSIKLAGEISKESQRQGITTPMLLEVNVAEEETKFGFRLDETEGALRKISQLENIKVCGLMTIAPFVEEAEENRQIFRIFHQFYVDMKSKNIDNVNMSILSMGMTGDFEVAIEEGATMVRVGTGIFGVRRRIGEQ